MNSMDAINENIWIENDKMKISCKHNTFPNDKIL